MRARVYGSYYLIDDEKYYYLETTGEGWELGEIPDEFHGVSAHYYEMIPTPIITHDWTAFSSGDTLSLTITICNEGTALADNYQLYAAFEHEDGEHVWNPYESEPFDLQFGRELTITVELQIPTNKHTRILVGVVNNEGYLIDKSYSEWFNT